MECDTCGLKAKLSCQSCKIQLCSKPKDHKLLKVGCAGVHIMRNHVKTHKGIYCLKCLGEDK